MVTGTGRILLLLSSFGLFGCIVDGLGVNWGQMAFRQLPPKTVVQMLKDNNITKVKLFEIYEETMEGLAGSDLEVMTAIPNYMLEYLVKPKAAEAWVAKNVTKYIGKGGVNIKYVAVGNEPFLTAYNGSYANITFPVLKNIQTALNDAGLGDKIKATVPLNADIYASPPQHYVPSAGYFRPDIESQMTDISRFLAKNKAPFSINIYPYINLYQNPGFPKEYAFFDGKVAPLMDGNISYTNSFDAAYDTLIVALEKAGAKDLPIFIGEVGWPTDGDRYANVELAQKFYNGLLKKLGNNEGTPLRPNKYIEVYMFGLLDEDSKSVDPGNFERHWGIFTSDGHPKFPMDLSGKGQNKMLVGAKKIAYLPKKWCVMKPNATKNDTLIKETIKYACDYADCTSLGLGCSCEGLDAAGNASYAFNMYFQTHQQAPGSCDFSGLAMVTTKNASIGNCTFPIRLDLPEKTPKMAPAGAPAAADGPSGANADGSSTKSSSTYHYGPSLLQLLVSFVALYYF